MLSALAVLGCGLAAAQGDLPDQPPGRSWQSGRFLLVSLLDMLASDVAADIWQKTICAATSLVLSKQ